MDAIRVAKVDNVLLERLIPPSTADGLPTRSRQTGTLHLTPHHLIFSPPTDAASTSADTSLASELWISYPSITLLTRLPQAISGLYALQIRTRTFDNYVLSFERDRDGGAEDVWQSVKDCAVASSVEQLYAFFYTLPPLQSTSKKTEASSASPAINPTSLLASSPEKHLAIPATHPSASPVNGWLTFNPRTEFARQGVGARTKAWRFTDVNKDYSFCPTYPSKLVVPSRISDSTLAYAVKYRSKGRIPALTYLHWANHASITRSSQPMVGLKNARSAQDERLVECIFSSHHSPDTAYAPPSNPLAQPALPSSTPVFGATTTNLIIDARPTANAMANVAIGAGSENMENYKTGRKAYLGIDNIHVMRNSLKVIAEAIREAEESPSGALDRGLLRKSNWLKHISSLLDGSLVIIKNIHLNASHVLIHCSDGWDRTSQLSAVAQVCLDPYYRTLNGFKVLMEKDWLAFGHKFLDRSGHLSSEKLFTVSDAPDEDSEDEGVSAQKAAQAFLAWGQKQFASNHHVKEISPVFHQFLDCVWQIKRQFPERFEFNDDYLLDLHYHLYACQFGTFVFNCERDRRVPNGGKAFVDRTVSAWDWFDRPGERAKYINESYEPALDDRNSRSADADQGVLLYDPQNVKFWHRLFRRGEEEMNGSKAALAQASGPDFLTVAPGQVDPTSVEGTVENVAAKVTGGEYLSLPSSARSRQSSPKPDSESRTVPNLANQVLEGISGKDSFRPFASTSSAFSMQTQAAEGPSTGSQSPFARLSRGLPSGMSDRSGNGGGVNGGSGWNWSQLSTSALGAIQGAAREIKSIGQEAISQIRAETTEVDGQLWTQGDRQGVLGIGVGEARAARQEAAAPKLPSLGIRVPSETNPWNTEERALTSAGSSRFAAANSVLDAASPPGTRPHAKREPSWNINPWGDLAQKPDLSAPSLADLTISGGRQSIVSVTGNPAKVSSSAGGVQRDGNRAIVKEEDRRMLEAAMGGDRKAWDPLGAL